MYISYSLSFESIHTLNYSLTSAHSSIHSFIHIETLQQYSMHIINMNNNFFILNYHRVLTYNNHIQYTVQILN